MCSLNTHCSGAANNSPENNLSEHTHFGVRTYRKLCTLLKLRALPWNGIRARGAIRRAYLIRDDVVQNLDDLWIFRFHFFAKYWKICDASFCRIQTLDSWLWAPNLWPLSLPVKRPTWKGIQKFGTQKATFLVIRKFRIETTFMNFKLKSTSEDKIIDRMIKKQNDLRMDLGKLEKSQTVLDLAKRKFCLPKCHWQCHLVHQTLCQTIEREKVNQNLFSLAFWFKVYQLIIISSAYYSEFILNQNVCLSWQQTKSEDCAYLHS